jgi:hypothetical protein
MKCTTCGDEFSKPGPGLITQCIVCGENEELDRGVELLVAGVGSNVTGWHPIKSSIMKSMFADMAGRGTLGTAMVGYGEFDMGHEECDDY